MSGPVVMQLILSAIAVLALQRVMSRWRRRAIGVGLMLLWSVGALGFIIVVWRPELANRVSDMLGVGRGVDAALYIAVAVLFYALLRVLIRLEHQEHLITKLVSELALMERRSKK